MEEVLETAMPWLPARSLAALGCASRAMAEGARRVHARRAADAAQGLEMFPVPVENRVDERLYPDFHYTPFSCIRGPLERRYGGPWGGGEEDPRCKRRTGVSESHFGGAMAAGSVLSGPNIGCRCPNDCCSMAGDDSPRRRSPEGRSTRSFARGRANSNLETSEGGVNRWDDRQEHDDGPACARGMLCDNVGHSEPFCKRSSMGSKIPLGGFPLHQRCCPCGQFVGGESAYDSNSRLRIWKPKSPTTAAEHGDPGIAVTAGAEDSRVQGGSQLDCWNAAEGFEEPPLVTECGLACSCSDSCKHRVSQHGLAVRVKVVRTNFKGWGLCSMQEIKRGCFVCEYAGELITSQMAAKRQELYDGEVHRKGWQGSALLTVREHLPSGRASVRVNIDGTTVGNVARFINHSCDGGNLIPCLIRTAGCIIPKLAFFARRDILLGEELTYSYGATDECAKSAKPCFCKTPACLGWLPFES